MKFSKRAIALLFEKPPCASMRGSQREHRLRLRHFFWGYSTAYCWLFCFYRGSLQALTSHCSLLDLYTHEYFPVLLFKIQIGFLYYARTTLTERPPLVFVILVSNLSSRGKALLRRSKIINQPKSNPNFPK